MQNILSSLAVGLHKAETTRTVSTLGDRSRYTTDEFDGEPGWPCNLEHFIFCGVNV